MLCSCTSKPTIYVYAKYLNDHQRKKINDTIVQSQRFHVEINDFALPTDISQNTLLYSILLLDPEAIDTASNLAASAGFPIKKYQALTQGNHWYTKNSMALFLLPKDKDAAQGLFQQDLVNTYKSKNCDKVAALILKKDGSFSLLMSPDVQTHNNSPIKGSWLYRQYPFIELQRETSSYADYYFEIKQYRASDNVSDINFIELKYLNAQSLIPEGCSFLIGTRI